MTVVHVVRHAKARNRAEWTEPDELRPLTKRGHRQAEALAERLCEEQPARLVSSPYPRCIETLDTLARALDLPIETTELLAEGGDGGRALDLVLSLGRSEPAVVCCTHGDVLFELLRQVAAAGVTLDGPLDAPVASTWALEVVEDQVVGALFVERPAT
jgi:broad specificity phosphatase PhoE